jgi:hypothetical protein
MERDRIEAIQNPKRPQWLVFEPADLFCMVAIVGLFSILLAVVLW